MHTGYDNYWMYQNRRQELVLCLPKNDNFSRPVFTDNYKQVQGTGHPSNLGNYISPPNTLARHHQKVPQDQHLVTGSQSMWPTSVCLPPYTSSLTHNFLSHDIFPVQPNNVCDSSQPMNQGLRNVQNSHVNISQVQSTNYKASAGPVNSQNNNYKTQTARIRVKDVFSLNNNSNNNKNKNNNNNNNNIPSLLDDDLCQTLQKKQHYYPFNSTMFRNSRMYNGQTQRECANYDMSELNHSYQNYGHPATHLNNEQQYLEPPTTFYQQNAQCTYEGPLCYNNVQQISEKSPEAFNRRNYPLLRQTLNENVIQQADMHNTQLDSDRHSDNNVGPSKNFGFNLPSVTESNETSTTTIQNQSALSKTIQAPCRTFISSANDQSMETTAKSPHHNPLNSQEISAIRLTNPHIDHSPNNSSYSEPNRNSESCLPALGASDSNPVSTTRRNSPAHDEVSTQEDAVVNLQETTEGSRVSPKSSQRCSTVTHSSGQQEPALDRNVFLSGNHRTGSPTEGVRGGTCKPAGSNDEAAVCQNEVVLLTPKVEKFHGEGESFEDMEAVNADGAALQMIKTEVDLPPQDRNSEEISEINFLESSEVSDVENAADIDIVSLENCESSSKSTSVTLKRSQESEVCSDTTEKSQNGNEKPKTVDESLKVRNDGNEKVALVVGGKYKSEINRDKLDLLIKFLKKEGGPVKDQTGTTEKNCPPSLINPTREDSWKQNRRKLSKTCVVKNKNTEREMVSLVSYKTPKCSSKGSSAKNSLNEIVEIRDSDPTEGSDHSENDTKGVSGDKQPEENSEDRSECKWQSKNTQGADKPLKETSENCSSNGKGVTTEERNIINIMRAFQNLKNHFCASCDFASPVESIWINVVSGELRCLNCFKKMMLKAEENPSNLRKSSVDGVNTSKTEDVHKDEAGDGRGNKVEKSFEKKSKGEGQTKSASKPEDLKGHVKKEVDECCENLSRNLKKESTLSKSSGKEQQDCAKRHVPVEQEEPELKNKGGKPARTNSAEEEHISETHRKRETKQTVDSPERCRKRNNSAEEFVPQKVQILEEPAKDVKQKAPRVEKSVPKECGGHQNNKNLEEVMKKSKKEDAKRQHSREGCTDLKTHKTEQSKLREEKRDHEVKRKEDNVSEKYKRKRTSSVEDVDPKKIRMVEEFTKGESKALSAERSKIRRDSKEDGHKNKTREKGKEEEWKARKHGESKEELHSRKGNGEPLNVATKLFDLFDRLKKKSPPNERKQGKAEASDPMCVPPKAKSPNEDCKMRRRTEEFDSKNPQSPKDHRKEAKDEKDGQKKLIEKHYRKSKQYLISRLFKGKQNTKVNPKLPKLIDKEALKVHEHQKHHRKQEERKSDKIAQERSSNGHTHPKSLNKKAEISLDKRKVSSGKPTDGKRHTKELPAEESWTIKGRKDKAVGCSFREIMKDVGGGTKSKTMEKEITYSTALLARLMKKTKKLSLSLLGEA